MTQLRRAGRGCARERRTRQGGLLQGGIQGPRSAGQPAGGQRGARQHRPEKGWAACAVRPEADGRGSRVRRRKGGLWAWGKRTVCPRCHEGLATTARRGPTRGAGAPPGTQAEQCRGVRVCSSARLNFLQQLRVCGNTEGRAEIPLPLPPAQPPHDHVPTRGAFVMTDATVRRSSEGHPDLPVCLLWCGRTCGRTEPPPPRHPLQLPSPNSSRSVRPGTPAPDKRIWFTVLTVLPLPRCSERARLVADWSQKAAPWGCGWGVQTRRG